ncbi:unnamed protein product [Oncorhynchus mykiss]|uniref:EGF-like domain-containing protein n=1 Tax=Oncorhynchus mykiss TaxID=8022 RepID=A0A060Z1N9_ONCMY|nr:unnamed protein product [Oncorhynchus mykiss]
MCVCFSCEPKETEGPRCQCVAGFTGNGTVCTEVNLCATGNGGCAQIANCTKTLPGERTCTCPEGYTGDGVWCLEIDGCLVNNGGCSSIAECIKTGPNLVRLHLFECQMVPYSLFNALLLTSSGLCMEYGAIGVTITLILQ